MFGLTVTVTCLILQQRYGRKYSDYQSIGAEDEEGESDGRNTVRSGTHPNPAASIVTRDIEDFGNVLRRNGIINLSIFK